MMKTLRDGKVVEITDDEFRRIHGDFRPLEIPEMPPLQYRPATLRHASTCLCDDCMTASQHMADYLKARKIFNDNGF